MKNQFTLSLVIFLMVCVGLGCRMISKSANTNYLESENAQDAAEKLKEKIGKPFKVYDITIEENEFRVQVQDPDKLQNLDEYKVIGGFVLGPNPVKTNAMQKDLEKSTFPFDQINFAAITNFTNEALKKSQIEGARVNRLTFQRAFAITESSVGALGNARWIIQIEGTRESVTAVATPDGKLLGVDRSQTNQAANYKVITPEELQKANDALLSNVPENAAVAEIVINNDYLTCSVENAENPSVGDSYKFSINGLTKSRQKNTVKTQISTFESFSLKEINLLNAGNLIAQSQQRIEMPGAVFDRMTINRKRDGFKGKVSYIIWTAYFKQGVNEATVVLNNEGKIIRINKNEKDIFEEKEAK